MTVETDPSTVPVLLQPFVILAKSTTGAACADLIKQATSAAGVYTFTALLECQYVQNLVGTDHEKALDLLKVFSWGTYQDYKGIPLMTIDTDNETALPPLNDAQLDKLRRLSLVSLASESHDLPYSTIMTSLDIPTTRALEDLCINTIYANLLTGKLSPHTQTFQITSCTSRDLHLTTTDYPGMISTLTQWSTQCDLVLAEIAGRVRDIKTSATDRKRAEETYEKQLEEARKAATLGKKTKKGKTTEEPETEVMQDVEEQPGPIIRGVNVGGESPSGRKRKLVRPQ